MAIVGDGQPALKAKVGFVFGRTIAQRRHEEPPDRLGTENPPLKPTGGVADGYGERINDLIGSLVAAQPLNKVLMHPGFDLPEVGTLPGEGTLVFEGRKPRTPTVMRLRVELLLAGIAQILPHQLDGQTFAVA